MSFQRLTIRLFAFSEVSLAKAFVHFHLATFNLALSLGIEVEGRKGLLITKLFGKRRREWRFYDSTSAGSCSAYFDFTLTLCYSFSLFATTTFYLNKYILLDANL